MAKILFTFVFMESIRQRQVAKIIQVAISDILQQDISHLLEGAMVTVSGVRVTPDLYTARIYTSIYNHKNPDAVIDIFDKTTNSCGIIRCKKSEIKCVPSLNWSSSGTIH
ncbi:MAG: ribosome-binding factor A [Chitinophagales bacterium]